MAFGLDELIETIRESRRKFLKHIKGMSEEQMDRKPCPHCKSVREIVQHLITDDRAYIHAMETGRMPDFASIAETETDLNKLFAIMEESHNRVCAYLREKYSDTPLDKQISYFGLNYTLGQAIIGIAAEDGYHTGQASYIRIATDPEWDYFKAIYSPE